MKEGTEVMLRLYQLLREEILQSIRFQHRVIIGGGVVIAVTLGIQVGGVLPNNSRTQQLIIAALPPVVVLSWALWVVEWSRMMRAGEYMAHLEDKINEELDGEACISWECSLHCEEVSSPHLHSTYHTVQRIVYIAFFILVGGLSGFYMVTSY